ncbi:MAG: adenylate/guanylate cyclase domain-containing protein [Geminicoccaceae bacterium]
MDVAVWLRGLGLERYAETFEANAIDRDVLPDLTDADLEKLGVLLGHRKKLLKAIADLADRGRPAVAPAPTAASESPDRTSGAERRQLTVMFCDLVGSTALSAQLDPEDMREVIRDYQDTCAGVITRFDGYVAKYMGDGVLAYFGFPRAHEDDAERAVRAGLALTEAVARLTAPNQQPMRARIGIATGLVVVGDLVGDGAAQEQAVVGDTPNLAARLQGIAQPGQVVVGDVTQRLLGAGFELQDLGAQALKGLSGTVGAFAVLAERAAESRFEARGERILPMVGRDQELALLLERWTQAKAGEGQGVLLVAEAGIGKSRITRALLDTLAAEPHVRIRYQCSPYHAESALWPVIQQLVHAAGIAPEDGVGVRLDKLEAMLGRTGDAGIAAPLIASLIGLDAERRYGPLDLTPHVQRARTMGVLVDQLLALARQQPVLVVLEDAHWVDPTTLELMEQCLDRIADARVLILMTSRPDHQPELAAHPHNTRLTLNRLGRAGVEAIVTRLGGERLPQGVIDAIIARTDGVPLFVEELTKAILETGQIAIPATLHDSLMARLDRIPEVKEVAQIAACIGREFDYALLAAVSDLAEPELQAALDRLASAELIFRRGQPPDARYTFKHALVQDTAYASLLRRRRQAAHSRLADVLATGAYGQGAGTLELLARHLTEAERYAEAVPCWQRAGEQAALRSAHVEAIAHLNQALEVLTRLPASRQRSHDQVVLLTALAGPLIATKGYGAPETVAVFERARPLAEEVGDPALLFPVLYGRWVNTIIRADYTEGHELALSFARVAAEKGTSGVRLQAHRLMGLIKFETGAASEARLAFERAVALYDPREHEALKLTFGQDPCVAALSMQAAALFELGFPDQAQGMADAAVAEAERQDHANTLGYALTYGSLVLHASMGSAALVERIARRLGNLADTYGMRLWRAYGLIYRGWAIAVQYGAGEGHEQIRTGLAELAGTGTVLHRTQGLGLLADALAASGEHGEALAAVDEALRLARAKRELWFEAELYRIKGALLVDGDPATAERCLEQALALARERQTRSWELRAATSLARLWQRRGDRGRSHALLAPILAGFTEGFQTTDLQRGAALLDELR